MFALLPRILVGFVLAAQLVPSSAAPTSHTLQPSNEGSGARDPLIRAEIPLDITPTSITERRVPPGTSENDRPTFVERSPGLPAGYESIGMSGAFPALGGSRTPVVEAQSVKD